MSDSRTKGFAGLAAAMLLASAAMGPGSYDGPRYRKRRPAPPQRPTSKRKQIKLRRKQRHRS